MSALYWMDQSSYYAGIFSLTMMPLLRLPLMKQCKITMTLTFVGVLVSSVNFASHAFGQVIQLPAYRNFSYSGSAWVPDAGTASLAGSGYGVSSSSSRGWGPYGGRAIGGVGGATLLSVNAQVIDLAVMDEALLRAASGKSTTHANEPNSAAARRDLFDVSAHRSNPSDPGPDPNAWQRALAGAPVDSLNSDTQRESDVRYYVGLGKAAEDANRLQAARVYYRMAQEAMTPQMVASYKQILAERKAAEETLKEKNAPDRIKF